MSSLIPLKDNFVISNFVSVSIITANHSLCDVDNETAAQLNLFSGDSPSRGARHLPVLHFYGYFMSPSFDGCKTPPRSCIGFHSGQALTGRPAVVHVYGFYPYFFVLAADSEVSPESFCLSLERTLQMKLALSGSPVPRGERIIHDVTTVHSVPFYGYYPEKVKFFKIRMYEPKSVTTAARVLLNSTAICGRRWQLYESHISLISQFMIDKQLSGAGELIVTRGHFPASTFTAQDPLMDSRYNIFVHADYVESVASYAGLLRENTLGKGGRQSKDEQPIALISDGPIGANLLAVHEHVVRYLTGGRHRTSESTFFSTARDSNGQPESFFERLSARTSALLGGAGMSSEEAMKALRSAVAVPSMTQRGILIPLPDAYAEVFGVPYKSQQHIIACTSRSEAGTNTGEIGMIPSGSVAAAQLRDPMFPIMFATAAMYMSAHPPQALNLTAQKNYGMRTLLVRSPQKGQVVNNDMIEKLDIHVNTDCVKENRAKSGENVQDTKVNPSISEKWVVDSTSEIIARHLLAGLHQTSSSTASPEEFPSLVQSVLDGQEVAARRLERRSQKLSLHLSDKESSAEDEIMSIGGEDYICEDILSKSTSNSTWTNSNSYNSSQDEDSFSATSDKDDENISEKSETSLIPTKAKDDDIFTKSSQDYNEGLLSTIERDKKNLVFEYKSNLRGLNEFSDNLCFDPNIPSCGSENVNQFHNNRSSIRDNTSPSVVCNSESTKSHVAVSLSLQSPTQMKRNCTFEMTRSEQDEIINAVPGGLKVSRVVHHVDLDSQHSGTTLAFRTCYGVNESVKCISKSHVEVKKEPFKAKNTATGEKQFLCAAQTHPPSIATHGKTDSELSFSPEAVPSFFKICSIDVLPDVNVSGKSIVAFTANPALHPLIGISLCCFTSLASGEPRIDADIALLLVGITPDVSHEPKAESEAPLSAFKMLRGGKIYFATEAELLIAFVLLIREKDPDTLLSWDSHPQKGGIGYISERFARVFRLSLYSFIGRARSATKTAALRAQEVAILIAALKGSLTGSNTERLLNLINLEFGDEFAVSDPFLGSHARDSRDARFSFEGERGTMRLSDVSVFSASTVVESGSSPVAGGCNRSGDVVGKSYPDSAASCITGGNGSEQKRKTHFEDLSQESAVTGRFIISLKGLFTAQFQREKSDTLESAFELIMKRPFPSFPIDRLSKFYCKSGSNKNSDFSYSWEAVRAARLHTFVVEAFRARSLAVVQICVRLDILAQTSEMARLYGILIEQVLTRGSQFKVESVLFRLAHAAGYVLPSFSREQVMMQNRQEGIPLVREPRTALYTDPVVVLDFRSLYPSIVIAYNLCYCTALGKVSPSALVKLGALPDYSLGGSAGASHFILSALNNGDVVFAPNSSMFLSPRVRPGVLPRMLRLLLDIRAQSQVAKKQAQRLGHRSAERTFENMQLALKLLANTTYGYAGATFTGRMPCSDLADAVVLLARQTLERAIRLVENTDLCNLTWAPAKVVYADTDSMFVHLPARTLPQAFDAARAMVDAINATNPAPITIKLERIYLPCLLLTKKRYVGRVFEQGCAGAKPEFKGIDSKGIETVRRDQCPLTARVLSSMLKILFDAPLASETAPATVYQTSLQEAKNLVRDSFIRILIRSRFPLTTLPKEFIFRRRGRFGFYASGRALPPAALAAQSRLEVDTNAVPLYKERISYIVLRPSVLLNDSAVARGNGLRGRVVDPLVCLKSVNVSATAGAAETEYPFADIDVEYYFTRHIVPALVRTFSFAGFDFKGWYSEFSRLGQGASKLISTRPLLGLTEDEIFDNRLLTAATEEAQCAHLKQMSCKNKTLSDFVRPSCLLCGKPVGADADVNEPCFKRVCPGEQISVFDREELRINVQESECETAECKTIKTNPFRVRGMSVIHGITDAPRVVETVRLSDRDAPQINNCRASNGALEVAETLSSTTPEACISPLSVSPSTPRASGLITAGSTQFDAPVCHACLSSEERRFAALAFVSFRANAYALMHKNLLEQCMECISVHTGTSRNKIDSSKILASRRAVVGAPELKPEPIVTQHSCSDLSISESLWGAKRAGCTAATIGDIEDWCDSVSCPVTFSKLKLRILQRKCEKLKAQLEKGL